MSNTTPENGLRDDLAKAFYDVVNQDDFDTSWLFTDRPNWDERLIEAMTIFCTDRIVRVLDSLPTYDDGCTAKGICDIIAEIRAKLTQEQPGGKGNQ